MIWLTIVLVVVAADALYARARLRLRTKATHIARRSHELSNGRGGEGWHSLDEGERGDAAQAEDNPFAGLDRIINSSRRGPR